MNAAPAAIHFPSGEKAIVRTNSSMGGAVQRSEPWRRSTTRKDLPPGRRKAARLKSGVAQSLGVGPERRLGEIEGKDFSRWPLATSQSASGSSVAVVRIWRPSPENAKPVHSPRRMISPTIVADGASQKRRRLLSNHRLSLADEAMASNGVLGEKAKALTPRPRGKTRDFFPGSQVPNRNAGVPRVQRNPPAVGGNRERGHLAGELAESEDRVALALPPKVAPLPSPQILPATRGALGVEEFARPAEVVRGQRLLQEVHVGGVGALAGQQLLGFGLAALVFGSAAEKTVLRVPR